MESIVGALAIFAMVFLFVFIAVYVALAIFLNKFNKLVNGKGTALAWIPICNIYLLGKLTVNKWVGWILVVCSFLTGKYTTTVNGIETSHTILPESINSVVSMVYGLAVLGLIIYAIVKYNQLKKSGTNVEQPVGAQTVSQQPVQPQAQPQVQSQTVSQQPAQAQVQPQTLSQQPVQPQVQPQTVAQQPGQAQAQPQTLSQQPVQLQVQSQTVAQQPVQPQVQPQTVAQQPVQAQAQPQTVAQQPAQPQVGTQTEQITNNDIQ